ncbi:G patch domain-containing protein 3 [Apodemus speciosus]|uniref:GPN-loop GTPase 2 n=1 Tax=Apodemus speciosus TaxID=105296 RepID=A0ABQ0EPS6_APOSI
MDLGSFPFKTRKELHCRRSENGAFTLADLRQLPELNPPVLMPNGNVGTPLRVFLELIRSCRLPPRIITQLQLQFPKTGSSRRYGNVPFLYEDSETVEQEEHVYTADGEEIPQGACVGNPAAGSFDEPEDEGQQEEGESGSEDDDDRGEEWERHEALHEDVTGQERTTERLFEEEIELKWEKGGSGLVFYTDAQFWQEEEGDFDEQTADDWDVDMSVYYDRDGGDKDARDSVQMRLERRLREGQEDGSLIGRQVGTFERHTKGIGRKVMERQGWAEGQGLGSRCSGVPEALDGDGQHPRCKRGLGYHGEKLQPFGQLKRPRGTGRRPWLPAPAMAGAALTTAFGQAVIGPPGSGKTTYCLGMSEFLRALGRRVAVVNLDPANEGLPYECAVDVGELVGLGDVMDALRLGPNGGLLYCMEYLEANLDWLRAKLEPLRGHYFLFDCPGQVELCTHHTALRSIFSQMAQWDLRLTAVHLVDSHYCTDPAKFISVLCTSLATMLHVELPHVNLLSKMDLIEHYGKLAFNLDYYTEVLDLSYLLDHLASDPFFSHHRQLNEKLVQLIEDYSLVSFIPLNIQDKDSIRRVLQAVDKANGYCFGVQEQRSLEAMILNRVLSTLGIQEKYLAPSDQTTEQEAMQL